MQLHHLIILIKALATLPPHRCTMPFPLAVPARQGFAFTGMCSSECFGINVTFQFVGADNIRPLTTQPFPPK